MPDKAATTYWSTYLGRALLTAGAVFAGGLFLYMVILMSNIVAYMGQMTSYMRSMSEDITFIHDHVSLMATEVSKVNGALVHMDENVNALNTEITLIEGAISRDVKSIGESVGLMSHTLVNMDGNVGAMSANIYQMGRFMSGMTFDIHRGTQSFTSPADYMKNMMR